MGERLAWAIAESVPTAILKFSGPVNEDTDFGPLVIALRERESIRMDLGGIERINSCGVREWVNFFRALPVSLAVELELCSPAIVSQLNSIANFVGEAKILSVQAPYSCPSCGCEQQSPVTIEQGKRPQLVAPMCPKCHEEMEFDDLEDAYFAFMQRSGIAGP